MNDSKSNGDKTHQGVGQRTLSGVLTLHCPKKDSVSHINKIQYHLNTAQELLGALLQAFKLDFQENEHVQWYLTQYENGYFQYPNVEDNIIIDSKIAENQAFGKLGNFLSEIGSSFSGLSVAFQKIGGVDRLIKENHIKELLDKEISVTLRNQEIQNIQVEKRDSAENNVFKNTISQVAQFISRMRKKWEKSQNTKICLIRQSRFESAHNFIRTKGVISTASQQNFESYSCSGYYNFLSIACKYLTTSKFQVKVKQNKRMSPNTKEEILERAQEFRTKFYDILDIKLVSDLKNASSKKILSEESTDSDDIRNQFDRNSVEIRSEEDLEDNEALEKIYKKRIKSQFQPIIQQINDYTIKLL